MPRRFRTIQLWSLMAEGGNIAVQSFTLIETAHSLSAQYQVAYSRWVVRKKLHRVSGTSMKKGPLKRLTGKKCISA
jgi:hypothetical protein